MLAAADLLEGLDGPAVVIDTAGEVLAANRAFAALPADVRAAALAPGAEAWRARDLPSGQRLLQPDRRGAGLVRRADVLATLSHELRTPLNGVLGMAQLLEATRLDSTQRAYLATVRSCGHHLLGLIGSVLDWARLDAGKIEVESGRADLEALLQGVAELLSPQAHAKGLDIAWAASGPTTTVIADDGRLRQILFNLAGNAVKMTARGGVRLTARTQARTDGRLDLRLEVADTGPGLEPDAQARIFEPFEQTEAGMRAGGAGLGLSIVLRLAEVLGGEVSLTSAPGEGAVFAFTMTVDPAEAAPASAPTPLLAGRTVAVVSASPVVAAAAALQVEALGGRVLGFPAWEELRLASQAIDLILYDVPARARLRSAPAGPPVIVLLTPEGRGRIPALRARGYAGYLIKPLRRLSLATRALAALNPAQAEPPLPGAAADDDRLRPAATGAFRVLLAEDNPVNAMLATVLMTREGCRVDRVATGGEAVEAGRAAAYDLILLDLRMPDMGGLQAARALRAAGVASPIAALTANAFEDDRRACREAGMDGFLSKPLERDALHALLAGLAARRAA